MPKACKVDPFGTGNHSDDLFEVYRGGTTPTYVCGYHYTYWHLTAGRK